MTFCPLDFEDYHRVFKFGTDEARFRDRRFWWDPSATEAGRRYRIATPLLPGHPPCATPPTCPPRICAATACWLAVTSGWLVSRRRVCIGRCGNVVRVLTACLQCKIKRKSSRAQRCRRAPSRPRSDRFGGWQGCERLAGLAASSVALDVAAMSLVFQLRVCSAHSIMIAVLHVVFSILSELSCLIRAARAW